MKGEVESDHARSELLRDRRLVVGTSNDDIATVINTKKRPKLLIIRTNEEAKSKISRIMRLDSKLHRRGDYWLGLFV